MARLLTVLALLAGAGLATSHVWFGMLDDDVDYAAIAARTRQLQEMFHARACFVESRDAALVAMSRGRLSLREACAEVRAAANLLYPIYLEHLADAYPQQSAEERLARNLLGHLTMLVRDRVLSSQALPDLERELHEWLNVGQVSKPAAYSPAGLGTCPHAEKVTRQQRKIGTMTSRRKAERAQP